MANNRIKFFEWYVRSIYLHSTDPIKNNLSFLTTEESFKTVCIALVNCVLATSLSQQEKVTYDAHNL